MTTHDAWVRREVRRSGPARTVDIAGTPWPLYKLEALAVALLVFVTILVVTQTLQAAVLTAAAVAVVVWWARRFFPPRP
ncbi:hypothetical protein C8E05_6665 [Rhodococcus wratislaviensis]|uniref:Uncharacterized protein n=1 Tax=Rhodococcus wratislaviensis TaxID=44752 RepID=A0AB38FC66_RHOWR|nr:hypothetical protein [Rhodococcus wratislaviensis]REE77157.1 hypothetical protein C8E05_6665 [Rhodococcus wratislaviensis]SPZ39186.1 Uncharacterised protein [Rhodococcus wratislaviensis]